MPNQIRIKRRAAGGASGAPSTLANAELAYNEQDNILYYGFGTGGSGGSATTIIPIAGSGSFAPLASPALTGTPTATTAAADTNSTRLATTAFVVGQASSVSPAMDGTAAIGTSLRYARADHVHPTDTSRAPLASPTLTGTPAAPTAAVDTNSTQLATTAFVVAQASAVSPVMDGTAAIGTSLRYARADHVHATDTSRAPLASPTFTGTPAAPTPTNGTNSTQLATTAYVLGTRLDQLTAPTAGVSLNSQKISNLLDPTLAQDAATKNYVDNVAQGLDAKQSVRAASTANLTLSGTQTVDGISLIAGDRVLVKNQTTTLQNGIYIVSASAWTRATDMNVWAEIPSAFTFVEQGTTLADTSWVSTSDQSGTLDTTAVTWAQFGAASSYTAGNGLSLTGNAFSVLADGTSLTVSGTGVRLSASYLGQNTITTLGTIATGVWNGTTIAVANGGSGATTLTGLLKGNGTSAFTAAVAGTDFHDTNSAIDGGTF